MTADCTLVLAVDGGSSKTDVALITSGGRVLGAARGRGVPYATIGVDAAMERLERAIAACRRDAPRRSAPQVAATGVYCLPGADVRGRELARALAERAWSREQILYNDTHAVLRAGTDRGWGVAVVCGTGLNCLGVAPTGRVVRFPAVGWLSGDLGGGYWVGKEAVAAAVRARDGRGDRTLLERLVPAHFGLARPAAIAAAVRSGRLDARRVGELPPLVFAAAAADDLVARAILDRLADEVVALVTATLRRLRLARADADVVLGGGLFADDHEAFADRIAERVRAVAPRANVVRLAAPPVVGAALLGLDALGADPGCARRVRAALAERARLL